MSNPTRISTLEACAKDALRPAWDEYFLLLAKLAAMRSTCLAFPVGAVIVKDKQVLATGYNGPPSKLSHCIEQEMCYQGLDRCDTSSTMPSRAIHAEANAIARAAKFGISTNNSTIYVTLEPCLSCLKLIISAGINEVVYETSFKGSKDSYVKDSFLSSGIITLRHVEISHSTAIRAALSMLNITSVPEGLNSSKITDLESLLISYMSSQTSEV